LASKFAVVALRVLNAIRNDELYVFTRPERRADVAVRYTAILSAMDKAALKSSYGDVFTCILSEGL
jgi:hypothetical protein